MDRAIAPPTGPMADHLTLEEKVHYGLLDPEAVATIDDMDEAARVGYQDGFDDGYIDGRRHVMEAVKEAVKDSIIGSEFERAAIMKAIRVAVDARVLYADA